MVYKWKTNFYKVDADVAGKVFEELNETVGLTAKSVVDASRDENAPLHNEFEWDDAVAGELWREQTARVMICNLTIDVKTDEKSEMPVRAFMSVEHDSPVYESITTILTDENKTERLMNMAMKELISFERKYATIEALAGVFREIDKLK